MCLKEPAANCQEVCPTSTNVPKYTHPISEGYFYSAWKANKQANVFPSVLGLSFLCALLRTSLFTKGFHDISLVDVLLKGGWCYL